MFRNLILLTIEFILSFNKEIKPKLKFRSNLIYFIFIFFISGCSFLTHSQKTNPCISNQAAIDIGSGSVKILIAAVNTCESQIQKTLWKDSKSLKIKESLIQNRIPDSIKTQIHDLLLEWKNKTQLFKTKNIKAIGTEVFRAAENGQDIVNELNQTHNLNIRIITQNEESILGFWSAVSASQLDPKHVVSWDIGGGSMQMTTLNANHDFEFFKGTLASVSFKDEYLKTTPCRGKPKCSPNPMGIKGVLSAVKMADLYAKKNVPLKFKKELKQKTVVGIGGVITKSVFKQLKKSQPQETDLNLNNLQIHIFELAKQSDIELDSDYAETEVTNMALVLGFMKRLEINSVKPYDVDLTTGLLIEKEKKAVP